MRLFSAKSNLFLAASWIALPISAFGQERLPLKIDLILPYNGVYVVTIEGIDHALAEFGRKVAGRPSDDERVRRIQLSV